MQPVWFSSVLSSTVLCVVLHCTVWPCCLFNVCVCVLHVSLNFCSCMNLFIRMERERKRGREGGREGGRLGGWEGGRESVCVHVTFICAGD